MHADSGLLTQLERFAFSPAYLYLWRSFLHIAQSFFRNAVLTAQMETFNSAMNALKMLSGMPIGSHHNLF